MPRVTSRATVFLWTIAALLLLGLGVGDRVLTHWAYALERGRIQASDEELAELHEQLPEVYAVSRAFKLVARIARPGVVSLHVRGGQRSADDVDEKIREHLRDMVPEDQIDYWMRRVPPGTGSGIILDRDGYILTNNHVVEGRSEIDVTLHDDRGCRANVIGTDPKTDLAVVKIDAPDLHPLKFGDSDALEVGDWVLAVGAPFGLSQTVTHGIVSAKGRTRLFGVGIDYQDFIQTDAAINPGNSGGPLLNLRGEVVGVNTAIATHGEGNAGIAFTIPSNLALKVAKQLRMTGTVQRGWLGVSLAPVDAVDVDVLGLPSANGVVIEQVLSGTPAERAGLATEDVVVAIDGQPVTGFGQFRALVADLPPHKVARFDVVRDEQPVGVDVRIGLQPENTRVLSLDKPDTRLVPQLGLAVRALRPNLARRYALPYDEDQRGVVVFNVEGRLDLRPRELVVACNGKRVRSIADLRRALESSPVGTKVRLEVMEPSGDRRIIAVKRRPAR